MDFMGAERHKGEVSRSPHATGSMQPQKKEHVRCQHLGVPLRTSRRAKTVSHSCSYIFISFFLSTTQSLTGTSSPIIKIQPQMTWFPDSLLRFPWQSCFHQEHELRDLKVMLNPSSPTTFPQHTLQSKMPGPIPSLVGPFEGEAKDSALGWRAVR